MLSVCRSLDLVVIDHFYLRSDVFNLRVLRDGEIKFFE
jgi:hypothetical protein